MASDLRLAHGLRLYSQNPRLGEGAVSIRKKSKLPLAQHHADRHDSSSIPGSIPVGTGHSPTPKPESDSVFECVSSCPGAEHRPGMAIGS